MPAAECAPGMRLCGLVLLLLACAGAGASPLDRTAGATAGASISAPHGSANSAASAVTVTDDWGRRVTLTARPGRIVSLAPHATESLVAAGALERLVAVDPSSDHPPAVRSLPRVAAYPAPDLEALAALRPDLVIVWGAGARASAIERIEALGIRVFVSDPRRSADVSSTLKRLAQFSPSPAIALEAAREFDSTMARLRDRYRDAPAVPVFVQIGSHPLMTLNDRDSIGDALRICGGRNVFAGVGTVAATVGPEAVLAAAPSLIVSTEAAGSREPWQSLGVLEPRGGLRIGWIGPAIHRPGPRFAALVEQLCGLIDEARSERPGHVSARSLR